MCDFHLLDPNNIAWVQNNYSPHSSHQSNSSQALAQGSAAPTPANKRQYQVLTSTSTKIPISLTTDTSIIETPAPQTPAQAKPKPRTPAIVKFAKTLSCSPDTILYLISMSFRKGRGGSRRGLRLLRLLRSAVAFVFPLTQLLLLLQMPPKVGPRPQ